MAIRHRFLRLFYLDSLKLPLNNMNQKGFSNILLGIVLVTILTGVGVFFVITNKSKIPFLTESTKVADSVVPYSSKLSFCEEEGFPGERRMNHQIVGKPDITPRIASSTIPTEVTVQTHVGNSPTLIPKSVELLRVNYTDKGEEMVSYGKMKDTGVDGNTRLFVKKITLNEPFPIPVAADSNEISFMATAEYKGLFCKPVSSSNFIIIVPTVPSPEEMFAQLADELERRDFVAVQQHFTDKEKNQGVKNFFEKLNEAEIRDFADSLRNAKLASEYGDFYSGGELRYYDATLKNSDGVQRTYKILLERSVDGKWVIDAF